MYYRFLAARKSGDDKSAISIAQWLSTNSTDSACKIQALAFLADTADKLSWQAPDELITIYEELTELLGTDSEVIARSRNSRVAANRLVELYLQANRPDSARRINQALNGLITPP